MKAAIATGEPVEDLSLRSETERVFAQPDGSWRSVTSTIPERVETADGGWERIDTDLQPVEGGLAPKVALGDVVISAGGDRLLASMSVDGRDIKWTWPSTLPVPIIDGDTATYRNVLPAADLVVTVTATGFSHNLVLREEPTEPLSLVTPVATDGATVALDPDGNIRVSDADSQLLAAAPPVMWDSSGGQESQHQDVTAVETSVAPTGSGAAVTLKPDPEFLSDPSTVYPVTIDPTYQVVDWAGMDTWVGTNNKDAIHPNDDTLYVGTDDQGTTKYRSYVRVPTGAWVNANVTNAVLRFRNSSSLTCNGSSVQVSRVTENWSGGTLTWNSQPTATGTGAALQDTALGYSSSCPAGTVDWDVSTIVQAWANGTSNYGVRVAGSNETLNSSYRALRSSEYTAPDGNEGLRPRLIVTYNHRPNTPTNLALSQANSTGVLQSSTPDISAKLSDDDGGLLRAHVKILQGTTLIVNGYSSSSPNVASGSSSTYTVPPGKLVDGQTYQLEVYANDGDLESASPVTRTITYDTTQLDLTSGFSPLPGLGVLNTVAGVGGPIGQLMPGTSRTLQVTGASNDVPDGTGKVFVSVAVAAGGSSTGYLEVGPGAMASPQNVKIDYKGGIPVNRGIVAGLTSGGALYVRSSTGGPAADVSVDVQGYWASDGTGANFYSLTTPQVVLAGPLGPGATQSIGLSGTGGIGTDPAAVALAVEVSGASANGNISISSPDDLASTANTRLEYTAGSSSPVRRVAVVTTGVDDGTVRVTNNSTSGATVTIRAVGWFDWPIASTASDGRPSYFSNTATQTTITNILAIEPGATEAEVQSSINDLAATAGVTTQEAASAMFSELEGSAETAAGEDGYPATASGVATRMSLEAAAGNSPALINPRGQEDGGGGTDWITLPAPRYVGDIFWSANAKYRYIVHGHVGMYTNSTHIIEAPGNGKNLREISRFDEKVKSGAKLSYVTDDAGELVSSSIRGRAVAWARSRIGDKYNLNFLSNTHIASGTVGSDDNKQNCSQMVWAAYKRISNIDLNPVEGSKLLISPALYWADKKSVMPWEIRDSDHTYEYKTVE